MAELGTFNYRGLSVKYWKSGFTINNDGNNFNKMSYNMFDTNREIKQRVCNIIDNNYQTFGKQYGILVDDNPMPWHENFSWELEVSENQTGEKTMKNANTAALFQDNMTTIAVSFFTVGFEQIIEEGKSIDFTSNGDKQYTYKISKDSDIKEGDYVVVNANNELKVVRVIERHEEPQINYDANIRIKWVVGKVDFAHYMQLQSAEKAFYAALQESEKKRIRDQMIESLKETHGTDLLTSDAVKALKGGE